MTKNTTCIDSALLRERSLKYKRFAEAFSYPKNKDLCLEYDRLFRQGEIWLYGSEHKAENEFQRANDLADINGFYKAFGLETDKERPDALPCELEFMHYLIFKEMNAPGAEKADICLSAQKKFFEEHLYPAAKNIAKKIPRLAKDGFYQEAGQELLRFLESEKEILR